MKTRNLLFAVVLVLFLTVAHTSSAAAGAKPMPGFVTINWEAMSIGDSYTYTFTANNVTVVGAPRGSYLVLMVSRAATPVCPASWWEISSRVAVRAKKTHSLTSQTVVFPETAPGTGCPIHIHLVLKDKNGIELARATSNYGFNAAANWVP